MLKYLRKKSNLTQTQLSFLAGVSIKTIYKIEKGDENVNYITVKKLAEFFETDVETIMKKNNPNK